jgi:hypothetical protein
MVVETTGEEHKDPEQRCDEGGAAHLEKGEVQTGKINLKAET